MSAELDFNTFTATSPPVRDGILDHWIDQYPKSAIFWFRKSRRLRSSFECLVQIFLWPRTSSIPTGAAQRQLERVSICVLNGTKAPRIMRSIWSMTVYRSAPAVQFKMKMKLFSLCLALLLCTVNVWGQSQSLINCLCIIESGCRALGCAMDVGSLSCGYYQIKEPYWIDCGRLGSGWQSCSVDKVCAENCVTAYLRHYGKSCTGDRTPTDEDYARIHNGGPAGCTKTATVAYWNKIKACMSDPCASLNPCQNGGICTVSATGPLYYTCACPNGFTGAQCQTVKCAVPAGQRTDCHPEWGATSGACEARGCNWCPLTTAGPWCFYPSLR